MSTPLTSLITPLQEAQILLMAAEQVLWDITNGVESPITPIQLAKRIANFLSDQQQTRH